MNRIQIFFAVQAFILCGINGNVTCTGSCAQVPVYAVALIPDSLITNANAVVRYDKTEFTLNSLNSTSLKQTIAITILNKNGDDFAGFNEYYDGLSKLFYIRGNIYDAAGKLLNKIKPSDIKDVSASSESSLYEEIRAKYYTPLVSNYPYTVEYVYEKTYAGSYYFPRWVPLTGYDVSVQHAELKIVVPSGYALRYKEYNLGTPVKLTDDGKNKTYTWQLDNTRAFDSEPYSLPFTQITPSVITAPSNFSLASYTGNMESWQNYAQWICKLNEGKDVLPEKTVNHIREITRNIPDTIGKIRSLYKYLQEKTRYVSIQLGIGGFQPFAASVVDEVGYGDCKALANYMHALLKADGIESYYTLIAAGGHFPQMVADFPSHQFNHAILCVPVKKDTIWLECTDQVLPFGFLGDFTSDRQALLIGPGGGELVRTKIYALESNYQSTSADVKLDLNGTGLANVIRKLGGLQFDDQINELHLGNDEQKKWLYSYIKIPNFRIVSYTFKQATDDKPESCLDLKLELSNFASLSDKRMFLPVNLMSRLDYIPPKLKQRKQNILVRSAMIDSDSIALTIPLGTRIEYLPEKVEIISPFGTYHSSVSLAGDRIIYTREFRLFKGNYPPAKYPDFIKFFREVTNADNEKAVLLL